MSTHAASLLLLVLALLVATAPLVSEAQCQLCPENSELLSDRFIPGFNDFAQPCLEAAEQALTITSGSPICQDFVSDRQAFCCSGVEPPSGCFLCPNGEPPTILDYLDPMYSGANFGGLDWENCWELSYSAAMEFNDENKNCAYVIEDTPVAYLCGCPGVDPPTGYDGDCRLCPGGSQVLADKPVLEVSGTCATVADIARVQRKDQCNDFQARYQFYCCEGSAEPSGCYLCENDPTEPSRETRIQSNMYIANENYQFCSTVFFDAATKFTSSQCEELRDSPLPFLCGCDGAVPPIGYGNCQLCPEGSQLALQNEIVGEYGPESCSDAAESAMLLHDVNCNEFVSPRQSFCCEGVEPSGCFLCPEWGDLTQLYEMGYIRNPPLGIFGGNEYAYDSCFDLAFDAATKFNDAHCAELSESAASFICDCPGVETPPGYGNCQLCPDDSELLVDYLGGVYFGGSCQEIAKRVSRLPDDQCNSTLVEENRFFCCTGVEPSGCLLCPDGSRPLRGHIGDSIIFESGDVYNSCDSLYRDAALKFSDVQCSALAASAASFLCGCEGVDPPPGYGNCQLCPEGSRVVDGYVPTLGSSVCRTAAEQAKYKTDDECVAMQEQLQYFCCEGVEPSGCVLCSGGVDPDVSYLEDPIEIDGQTYGSCAHLEFDAAIKFSSSQCSELEIVYGAFFCGCPNADTPEGYGTCSLCPEGSTLLNETKLPSFYFSGFCNDNAKEALRTSDAECENFQAEKQVLCCEGVEPNCNLCPDGSEPSRSTISLPINGRTYDSCDDLARDVLTKFDETQCLELEAVGASFLCGCKGADEPPRGYGNCGTLCPDGSSVRSDYTQFGPPFNIQSCGDVEQNLLYVADDQCDSYLARYQPFCCRDFSPTGCYLCPDGNPPTEYFLSGGEPITIGDYSTNECYTLNEDAVLTFDSQQCSQLVMSDSALRCGCWKTAPPLTLSPTTSSPSTATPEPTLLPITAAPTTSTPATVAPTSATPTGGDPATPVPTTAVPSLRPTTSAPNTASVSVRKKTSPSIILILALTLWSVSVMLN